MTIQNKVKALVMRTAGTNCDNETAYALKLAGADTVDLVHINSLIRRETSLERYQLLAFPGGFSYGDDVSAGKIYATQLKYKLFESLRKFDESGKLIIGICNGFQILVKLGLLPGDCGSDYHQTATLTWNNTGRFECRWVYLKTETNKKNLWTKGLPKVLRLPIAHAEGKFISANTKQLNNIEKNLQVVFRYCDAKGDIRAPYPFNPNGSTRSIAGMTNPAGNVFGLMPHPERFILKYQYAAWSSLEKKSPLLLENDFGIGLQIFKNAVEYARQNL